MTLQFLSEQIHVIIGGIVFHILTIIMRLAVSCATATLGVALSTESIVSHEHLCTYTSFVYKE
jgi:hypothetical protein